MINRSAAFILLNTLVLLALPLMLQCGPPGEATEKAARTAAESGEPPAGGTDLQPPEKSKEELQQARREEKEALWEIVRPQVNNGEWEGRWKKARSSGVEPWLSEEQRKLISQLDAIGYAQGSVEDHGPSGIIRYNRAKAFAGLNLVISAHAAEASLMDMEGHELHSWSKPFGEVWPDDPRSMNKPGAQYWRDAILFENGDLLAIYEGLGLIRIDKDSRVIWAVPNRAHHDMDLDADGDIYVLTRTAHLVPRIHAQEPILEDFISRLDARGREKMRISVLECFENSARFRSLLETLDRASGDIFHTNGIEILDGRFSDRVPELKAGNILISVHRLHCIAVVDPELQEVVWVLQGDFKFQHDPRLLDNGRVMLFDNRGRFGRSSVQEYDLLTREMHMVFRGSLKRPFFTLSCGTNQRLPNGNTLITESDNGRAFEVTPNRGIVWDYRNPRRAGEENEYVATLFEVVRLAPDFPVSWAAGSR
jgi:hypothetical protein